MRSEPTSTTPPKLVRRVALSTLALARDRVACSVAGMDIGQFLDRQDKTARHRRTMAALEAILPDFRASRVLKHAEGRAVIAGHWRGQAVVIKQFDGPDADETVQRLCAELTYLAGHMKDGPNRMMRLLHADPGAGLAVLEQVPGQRLSDVLAATEGPQRLALIRQAGDWLALYCQGRRRAGQFAPRHWLARREGADASGLSPANREVWARLRSAAKAMAPVLRGHPVTRAATHGDFAAINLHWDAGVLYGVDVQGEAWLPLVRDVAVFLVWAQMTRRVPTGAREDGIDAADRAAFLASGILPEAETGALLRFMIADQLGARLLSSHDHDAQRNALVDAILAWLGE